MTSERSFIGDLNVGLSRIEEKVDGISQTIMLAINNKLDNHLIAQNQEILTILRDLSGVMKRVQYIQLGLMAFYFLLLTVIFIFISGGESHISGYGGEWRVVPHR